MPEVHAVTRADLEHLARQPSEQLAPPVAQLALHQTREPVEDAREERMPDLGRAHGGRVVFRRQWSPQFTMTIRRASSPPEPTHAQGPRASRAGASGGSFRVRARDILVL